MKTQIHEGSRTMAAAERQMRTWVQTQESKDRAVVSEAHRQASADVVRCISISRETGARGSEVADLVGQRLGWKVFDKNLLDGISEQFHDLRSMLNAVDETPANWAYDVLGAWMEPHLVTHEKYIAHLRHVVKDVTRHGQAVIVGRGSQFLLPRDTTLAVRLIASEKYRLQEIMRRHGIDEAAARRFIRETDLGRGELVKQFFHCDVGDPHLYDLVLDIERFGPTGAAEMILAAIHQRNGGPA